MKEGGAGGTIKEKTVLTEERTEPPGKNKNKIATPNRRDKDPIAERPKGAPGVRLLPSVQLQPSISHPFFFGAQPFILRTCVQGQPFILRTGVRDPL